MSEIFDHLYSDLKEEVLKLTNIGQGKYQKSLVIEGDGRGLLGLGRKCAGNDKEVTVGVKRDARLSHFQIKFPAKTLLRVVTDQFEDDTGAFHTNVFSSANN